MTSRCTKYRFERLDIQQVRWEDLAGCLDHTIYQRHEWLTFIAHAQHAEPVVAVIKEGDRTVGYFTGLIVQRMGMRILGSPCPGWSTDYMGFALGPGASRRSALQGLFVFAFEQLHCVHLELMDRNLTTSDLVGCGTQYRSFPYLCRRSDAERDRSFQST